MKLSYHHLKWKTGSVAMEIKQRCSVVAEPFALMKPWSGSCPSEGPLGRQAKTEEGQCAASVQGDTSALLPGSPWGDGLVVRTSGQTKPHWPASSGGLLAWGGVVKDQSDLSVVCVTV